MMDFKNAESRPPFSGRSRWQFGLPALLGTMMLLCLPFALWGAILRAKQADQSWLILLCVAAPIAVLVLAGTVADILHKRRRRSADRDNEP